MSVQAQAVSSGTMRVVEISRPGGPEVLTAATRPRPEPQAGEVVIRVAWAGVNRPDALQRAGATGSTLRPQSVRAKAVIAEALRTEVWPLLAAGKVRPVMDRVFPLADAREAHARIEASDHIGKIVLEVAGG